MGFAEIGKATRVIVTQYDMPRKDTVAHDSDVDAQGRVEVDRQGTLVITLPETK